MFGMPSTTATSGTGLSVFAAAHATSPRDAHAMYSELFASRTRQTSPRSKTSLLSKITSRK
ncbi:hypothetical protein EXIGLDRAFT_716349 [Exidia glandulosa HHB12029]|uniref:Uncharacterized protein n=1 Tax=Exidia glandulosa HHB12029 TaxID=1314781 RepID=A0A165R272_EXIGL|nr:hypothetical protein EXIGLDRAFT_716349 [Exidia glandulosa HHB12029]